MLNFFGKSVEKIWILFQKYTTFAISKHLQKSKKKMRNIKNTERGRIFLKKGNLKDIAEKFGTTHQTVSNALRGVTKSYLTEQIRKSAIEDFGGVELVPKS